MKFLEPVESMGHKFDRGMFLFEFDALREPEKTRFPKIGEFLRKRCEFVEVPTPSMLWKGRIWPDLFIANRLDAAVGDGGDTFGTGSHARNKSRWQAGYPLDVASIENHGEEFHAAFIEPMCRKITGRTSSEISAKYHRAAWLPLYYPQTLRARQSLRTTFHYPAAGYAGAATGWLRGGKGAAGRIASPKASGTDRPALDAVEIRLEFMTVKPIHERRFSVLFVVDESPIYRITDMDECAGIETEWHRWIVEYRGDVPGAAHWQSLGLMHGYQSSCFDSVRMEIPSRKNALAGWRPRPNINERLWEEMNAEACA